MERTLEEGVVQQRGAGAEQAAAIENHCLRSQMSKIEELLKKNVAVPDTETEEGQTPLLFACYQGSPQDVQTFLNLGCCPGYFNQNGCTPLMAAAAAQSREKVLILMSTGDCCIPEARDIEGKRAANYAKMCSVAKSYKKCTNDSAGLIQLLSLAATKGCNVALCWWNNSHKQLENSTSSTEILKCGELTDEYTMVKHYKNVVPKIYAAAPLSTKQEPNRGNREAVVAVNRCRVCTLPMPCEAHSKAVNECEIVIANGDTTEEAAAAAALRPQNEKEEVLVNDGQQLQDSFSFYELYKHHHRSLKTR